MNWHQLFALLISTAVVSSSVLDPLSTTVKPVKYDISQDGSSPVGVIDIDIVLDGIALDNLNPDEVNLLLADKDSQLVAEFDIIALRKVSEARVSDVTSDATVMTRQPGIRKKRAFPLIPLAGIAARAAFVGARSLFRGAARTGLSRSGSRVTQQYTKSGGFNNAMRDFNRFGVQNQKTISGKYQGSTGTVGRHRVTVRSGSSGGKPTLEIRTPKAGRGEFVRKFRYD